MNGSGMNLTDHEERQIQGSLLTLRIIAAALMMGVVMMAVILIAMGAGPFHAKMSILVWVALGGGVLAIIGSAAAPSLMTSVATSSEFDMKSALAAYSTRVIIGLAILEGAAFLNVVVYFVTGNWLPLAATAVLILLMFAKFPSRGGMVRWIEERKQLAELDGGLSGRT